MLAITASRLRFAPFVLVVATGLACASGSRTGRAARHGVEAVEPSPGVAAPRPALAIRPASTAPPIFDAVAPSPPRPLSDLAGARGSGEVIEIVDDLRFAVGAPVLEAAARGRLDALAVRLLRSGPGWTLEIQGHSDAAGSDAENILVGLRRAEAVRDYLHRVRGVALDRMAVVSLGASQPVADNATPAGRARNRRAVVLVMR